MCGDDSAQAPQVPPSNDWSRRYPVPPTHPPTPSLHPAPSKSRRPSASVCFSRTPTLTSTPDKFLTLRHKNCDACHATSRGREQGTDTERVQPNRKAARDTPAHHRPKQKRGKALALRHTTVKTYGKRKNCVWIGRRRQRRRGWGGWGGWMDKPAIAATAPGCCCCCCSLRTYVPPRSLF